MAGFGSTSRLVLPLMLVGETPPPLDDSRGPAESATVIDTPLHRTRASQPCACPVLRPWRGFCVGDCPRPGNTDSGRSWAVLGPCCRGARRPADGLARDAPATVETLAGHGRSSGLGAAGRDAPRTAWRETRQPLCGGAVHEGGFPGGTGALDGDGKGFVQLARGAGKVGGHQVALLAGGSRLSCFI